jgi:hypothetical protein
MDFTNRGAPAPNQQDVEPNNHNLNVKRPGPLSNRQGDRAKWGRLAVLGGITAVAVLLIGLIVLVAAQNKNVNDTTEANYIKTNDMQAVFLNTGQVYFGKIGSLNSSYLTLSNIYYLQTSSNGQSSSSSSSNSNVTLVKLGCELHKPYDQMVINRAQVTFWENLDSSGQVGKAVAKYQSTNPTHQCVDQSSAAGSSSGSATQNAPTTKP